MDEAVRRYRERRNNRLEAKAVEEYFARRDALLVRMDDDDEESGNGHGNTRIPFGLCQREGINIGKDWTPKDAWSALEGKGYSATEAYKELKETGHVSKKEPAKPKGDWKQASKTIDEYEKKAKQIKKVDREKAKVEKELRESKDKAAVFEKTAEKKENYQRFLLNKYGEVEEMPRDIRYVYESSAAEGKLNREMMEKERQRADGIEKRLEEINKKRDEIASSADEESYNKAIDTMLSDHPYAERVHEYRRLEEGSADDRRELKDIDGWIAFREEALSNVEKEYEKAVKMSEDESQKEFTRAWYRERAEMSKHSIESHKRELNNLRERRGPIAERVAEADKKMKEATGDADGKDWDRIYSLENERSTVKDGPYDKLAYAQRALWGDRVKYEPPHKFVETPTEDRIIRRLTGSDKTRGSCVSLAFAYVVNKSGYDVLDFRGAASQKWFSQNWKTFGVAFGAMREHGKDDIACSNKLLGGMVEGKEYVLMTGSHASIVRRRNGANEYLELQSRTGGWKPLNDSVLKNRFGCRKRPYSEENLLFSVDKMLGNQELVSLSGYINTNVEKQKKGEGGSVK